LTSAHLAHAKVWPGTPRIPWFGWLLLPVHPKLWLNSFSPLTQLLKKNAFHWSDAANTAFQALKQALSAAPVLQLPDFEQSFTVECDASGTGF
jgi:hypothetical protein